MKISKISNPLEVIKYLIEVNNEIAELNLLEFNSNPVIQDKITTDSMMLNNTIQMALELRSKTKLPFWDCFNLQLFDKTIDDTDIFEYIIFHNENINKKIFKISQIESLIEYIDNSKTNIAISSKILTTDGNLKHFKLMDFHIPFSETNTELLIKLMKKLDLKGFLLRSGKSYHFYGLHLVDQKDLNKFLGKMILLSPITDKNWIAHQLIEEECHIRLTSNYGISPYVLYYSI